MPADGSFVVRDSVYSEGGPEVAMNRSGEFAVGWSAGYLDGTSPAAAVSVQRYDAAGAERGGLVSTPGGDPSLALDDAGNLFTAWVQGNPASDSDVYARRYNPQNQPLEAAFRVNATTSGVQNGPVAAVDAAGRVTVLWSSSNSGGAGLFGRRFTYGTTPIPGPDPQPQPTTGSISGTVFDDVNGDGRRQTAEAGVSARRVWLDLDNDGARDAAEPSLLTDHRGMYRFGGLTAGTYRVRQVLPTGWRTSYPASGAHRVTLSTGVNAAGKNFATTRNVLISGTVFNDADRDGRRDGGESALSGWRVYADADNDGRFDSGEKSVLTDGSGNYRFTSLAAGTHRVRVVQQSGWVRTAPTGGVHTLTLTSGALASGKLFGQRRA